MISLYERGKNECNYHADRFHRDVKETGGLAVAKELIASNAPRNDLLLLHRLGRLDISTEALALNHQFRGLFTEDELNRARTRLRCLNYNTDDIS